MSEDSSNKLRELFKELTRLQGEGKEEEAKQLLSERFDALPDETKGELLAHLYIQALDEKVAREDTIADIQLRGMQALDQLERTQQESGGGAA